MGHLGLCALPTWNWKMGSSTDTYILVADYTCIGVAGRVAWTVLFPKVHLLQVSILPPLMLWQQLTMFLGRVTHEGCVCMCNGRLTPVSEVDSGAIRRKAIFIYERDDISHNCMMEMENKPESNEGEVLLPIKVQS
ncbi:hypothetical protein VNO77_15012 [Canavalia gladiata]|uniref:Uncharacterized protein n=1 Tax=Canavalia gladiata TaxID=3824 RepID=A0AAN9QS71_CANGL